MGPENAVTTKEIRLPPMTSSVSGPVLSSNEVDDGSLASKVSEQEEEIKELKSEVRKLRQCVKGVHLIGRKLQKSKEENRRLKRSLSNDLKHQHNDEWIDDEEDKTKLIKSIKVVPGEDNSPSYNANSSDECSDEDDDEDDESSSSEEEHSSDSEKESESLDEDINSDQEVDEFCASNEVRNTSSRDVHELRNENSKQRQEIKELKAVKEAEGYHYVTSIEANELQKTATIGEQSNSVGSDTDDLGWDKRYKELETENTDLKAANTDLKATVKEIKNVNHKWDEFWKDKKGEYDARLKEKSEEISNLQKEIACKDAELVTLKDIHAEKDQEHEATIKKMERVITAAETKRESMLKDKEELLLTAKQRIDNTESTIETLRSELSKEQQKCEQSQKYARILLKQKKELEEEIKRLNGTLTEKCEENSLLKSMDPKMTGTAEIHHASAVGSLSRPSGLLTPPSNLCMTQDLMEKILDRQPARYQRSSAPSGDEHGELLDEDERSLTKDELKEKVELFREQTQAFESDFRRERRDREAVIGQLDSVKRELREAKAILHNGPKPPTFNFRQKDGQIHDPLLRDLQQGYQRSNATQKHYYPNKRDNLIAHGHGSSGKTKERSSKSRREHQRHLRHYNDHYGHEREIFDDEEEQYHVCRCPKHNCYIPVGNQMNKLSKPHCAY